jgi:hypothetical protein
VATDDNFTNIVASATVTTNSYDVTGCAYDTKYVFIVLQKNKACLGKYRTDNLYVEDRVKDLLTIVRSIL